jgi:hypothetical protein
MVFDDFEIRLNILSEQVEHLLEHPEQITLENVQSLELPQVQVNDDLISKLNKYTEKRLKDEDL